MSGSGWWVVVVVVLNLILVFSLVPCFKSVSIKFQGYLKKFSMVLKRRLKGVFIGFQGYLRGVQR